MNVSLAENEKEKADVIGWGAFTCYEFINPSKEKNFIGRDRLFFSWAQGYMSAFNVLSHNDNVDFFSIDPAEQLVILKVFCEDNKLKAFAISVENLYLELLKKTDARKKKEK